MTTIVGENDLLSKLFFVARAGIAGNRVADRKLFGSIFGGELLWWFFMVLIY